jgi:2,4-diaminopentanoate dehydrogenase
MSTRVVQWATGNTGKLALRAVIDDPELELVGVRVYDEDKAGKDAGELVDGPPTGVLAVDNLEAVLEIAPDVVLYMGRVEQDTDSCVADIAALLASGADVVATGAPLIDPDAVDPERGRLLEAACKDGSSSFLGLGLFPGFWGEALAPILTRLSYRCDRIAVRESLSYAGYASTHMMFAIMGYGHPPESTEPMLAKPRTGGSPFNATATIIAKAIGLEIDAIESFREVAVTETDLHVAAGLVPAGTVGAMKLGVRADCGPVEIVVEHVTWMDAAVQPEWSRSEGYEIELDGAPTLRCNLLLGTKGEDHTEMGCLATAMHAVHAIPAVRAAEPGVLDLATVPSFVGSLR